MRKLIPIVAVALSILTGAGGAVAAGPDTVVMDEPHFVPMPRIAIPIVDLSRIEGALDMTLTLQATDAATATVIAEKMPALRAASLVTALEFGRLHASGFTAVNAEQLNADLTAALKRVDPDIARVLIVNISAQPA